jgi:hypothetical protein
MYFKGNINKEDINNNKLKSINNNALNDLMIKLLNKKYHGKKM